MVCPASAATSNWILLTSSFADLTSCRFLPSPTLLTHSVNFALTLRRFHSLRRLLLTFHLRQALLERSHQVHYRRGFAGLFDCGHFPALQMRLYQLFHVFFKAVAILAGVEFRLQRLDELVRHFHFCVLELHRRRLEFLDAPHFIFVVHGVQHESLFEWTQKHRVLAVVHGELGNGDVITLPQR